MHALARNSLPIVSASDSLRSAFLAKPISAARLLAAIEADYRDAYGALAHPFRARVVGALLAISCGTVPDGRGLYSQQMLMLCWNASFVEEAACPVPIWVEAAYAFALCAKASRQQRASDVAQSMLKALAVAFPLPNAGVFDLDDIHSLGGGTRAA